MPNLEYKKDCVCEGDLNLARNLLLKDVYIYPRTGDFRPMVSSAVWVKRLRRENVSDISLFRTIVMFRGITSWIS